MPEETPEVILDSASPNRIADAFRRLQMGNAIRRLGTSRTLTQIAADMTVAAAVVTFVRPVLSITAMTATVGAQDATVQFVPPGSAVAVAGSVAAPVPHTATIQKDADGRITGVTFSGAPTLIFAEVHEAPANVANRIAVDLS